MNFLAHAHLSGTNEELIIGNFIADRVKGSAWKNYPPGIQSGILLHRFIDDFTDKHPINRKSSVLLAPHFGKYSVVVTDVMNDHLLAVNWSKYHPQDLNEFIRFAYGIFTKHESVLPDFSRKMLPYMIQENWLGSYRHLEGISSVLYRMSKRTPFASGMEKSYEPLMTNFVELEENFHLFFPELQMAVNEYLIEKKLT